MLPLAVPATPISMSPSSGDMPRSVCTSDSVDSADGPSSGITWNAITELSSLVAIGATARTFCWSPSCCAIPSCVDTRSSSETAEPVSATTSSVPFMPSPKFSSIAVYALYWVESAGSDAPVGMPRRIDRAGIAITSSSTMLSRPVMTARPVPIGLTDDDETRSIVPAASALRSFLLSARSPIRPMRAGVNVTAIMTAMATQSAPTLPIRPRKPMPETFSASSATSTVAPANTTALPEVPLARPIDSCRS